MKDAFAGSWGARGGSYCCGVQGFSGRGAFKLLLVKESEVARGKGRKGVSPKGSRWGRVGVTVGSCSDSKLEDAKREVDQTRALSTCPLCHLMSPSHRKESRAGSYGGQQHGRQG